MNRQDLFYQNVRKIAVPVTLQSLLQSSFSVVDQVMIGQLGSSSIAGVGLGAKFSSVYSVILGAVTTVTGIMISQYLGQKNKKEVSRSFWVNLFVALGFGLLFAGLCSFFPEQIMGLYTKDRATAELASGYLRILTYSFIPMAVSMIVSAFLRCMEAAMFPLYAGITAVILNTGLNYVLIFGRAGFPEMGVKGAALATVLSQVVSCILICLFFILQKKRSGFEIPLVFRSGRKKGEQYLKMLLPILLCEFCWSLGENVYTAIYGNMGTDSCAAMTLTIPIQSLLIGAFNGLGQASGIMIGKLLGSGENEKACRDSRRFMACGFFGSLILSAMLIFLGKYYVEIYQVEDTVKNLGHQILLVFAVIAPVKIQNMILGGGIIRSGGKTAYIMWVDLVGTWLFGVPLGLLSAFVWKLSVPYVYLMLSLEECVRFAMTEVIFRKKKWMTKL